MQLVNETPFRFTLARGTIDVPNDVVTLIVKGSFRTRHGEPALPLPRAGQALPTLRRPYRDGARAGSFYPGDFATFKPMGDALVVGTCHAPGGVPVPRCDVAFTIGNRRKTLAVFGDRYWVRDEDGTARMTEPEPFAAMPLRYENAFGSGDYLHNPLGKGRHNDWDIHPDGRIPLPNVEDPDRLIRSIDDAPPVAGFGPVSEWAAARVHKQGSKDVAWAKRDAPRKPADFDWTAYNAAPDDQQVEGFFRGDEVLSFENMHPEHNPYRVHLAGLRVRLFVNRTEPDGTATFLEPPLNLDTVWTDLDEERLIQVWRGVLRVRSYEHRELTHVFVVSERLEDDPLPLEHYRDLLRKRLAPPELPRMRAAREKAVTLLGKAKGELDRIGFDEAALAELRAEEDPKRFLDALSRHLCAKLGVPYPPPKRDEAKPPAGTPPA